MCERCFAPLAPGEAFCPECGAPTGESTPGADSAVHNELASANLLRLRGDLDGSEKALLGILRRYPNDPFAHEMLGDVCAARGETERAKEWYELALDLAPNSTDIRRKLEHADDVVEEQVTADTAETLGLPPSTPPTAWWPLAGAATLLLLAVLVAAWPRNPAPASLHASVAAPKVEVSSPAPTMTEPTNPEPQPPASGSEEDRRLLTELQRGANGTRVQGVVLDPRTQGITVTFEAAENDDLRAMAVGLGREVLNAAPAATTVTLRAIRAGTLVFTADLARTAMNDPNPLINVWPSAAAGTQPTMGTPSTGGNGNVGSTATTGETTTGTMPSATTGGTAPPGSATTGTSAVAGTTAGTGTTPP